MLSEVKGINQELVSIYNELLYHGKYEDHTTRMERVKEIQARINRIKPHAKDAETKEQIKIAENNIDFVLYNAKRYQREYRGLKKLYEEKE